MFKTSLGYKETVSKSLKNWGYSSAGVLPGPEFSLQYCKNE